MTEVSTDFYTKTSDDLADEKKRIDRELKYMKQKEKEAADR
jgi:hypothetical protein